jgi:selenocysteine lyase/cysteine desulfurase
MNQVAAMWQHKLNKVLLLEGDYPSVILPFKAHGYQCHYFKAEVNDIISLQTLEDHLKEVKPDLLAISHVQFNTGFRIDLKEVADLCKKYGVRFLVDATQSFGAYPINVPQQGIDVLLTSVYKWTTAGYGLGLCYINPELFEDCHPLSAGNNALGQAIIHENNSDLDSKKSAFETGHTNFPAMSALNNALTELLSYDIEQISQRIDTLIGVFVAQLHKIIGDTPILHFPKHNRSGILSIDVPQQIQTKLMEANIVTSFRNKGLRVSAHFYNNESDIEKITSTLATLLSR